jgi:hypothetical protein
MTIFQILLRKRGLSQFLEFIFWSFMFWYYHPPNIISYDFIQFIQNPTNLPWDLFRQSYYGVFVWEVALCDMGFTSKIHSRNEVHLQAIGHHFEHFTKSQ